MPARPRWGAVLIGALHVVTLTTVSGSIRGSSGPSGLIEAILAQRHGKGPVLVLVEAGRVHDQESPSLEEKLFGEDQKTVLKSAGETRNAYMRI